MDIEELLELANESLVLFKGATTKEEINTCSLTSIAASLLVIATKMAEDK